MNPPRKIFLLHNTTLTIFCFVTADQTPTPTRFIRNCEEVGLFQDLQNVNPFEETFRRAVEAGKSGTLAVPEVRKDIIYSLIYLMKFYSTNQILSLSIRF